MTAPETRRVFTPYGHMATAGEEGLALLQSRIALCWKVTAISTGIVTLLAAVMTLPRSGLPALLHPSVLVNAAITLLCSIGWLVLRGARRPFAVTAGVDLLGGLLILVTYAMGFAMAPLPDVTRPDLILTLITTIFVALRAIAIPATVRHMVVVSALISLPALAFSIFFHVTVSRRAGSMAGPMLLSMNFCLAPTAIAAFAAWIIYGLRAQVAEAKRLGQYVLERKLGEGGMGQVFLAQHALLRRPTAIKLLFPERVGPDTLARFEREVRLTATLTHPNTVSIFDYGRTPEGVFYYAMEYLDGIDLESMVRRFGPQPPARVVHLLQQACASLAEAHSRGLVHRDIKPANIILCERGGVPDTVKVVDFGLVKDRGVMGAGSSEPTLTHANAILGTPLYMPPESLRGDLGVDGRADLYALAAVGCFLLSGRPVFEAGSVLEVCALHLNAPPRAPSLVLGSKLPEDLEALLLRCLAKEPAQRPAGAAELRRELCACAVPAWTEEEARAWWAGHRDAGGPADPSAPTAALDTTAPA
jgi:eukaryotic-like serine/threonine-protein kinase